jgi:hypothetical protein
MTGSPISMMRDDAYVPRWYCLSDKMTRKLSYTRNKKKVYHRADWWHDDSVTSKFQECEMYPWSWTMDVSCGGSCVCTTGWRHIFHQGLVYQVLYMYISSYFFCGWTTFGRSVRGVVVMVDSTGDMIIIVYSPWPKFLADRGGGACPTWKGLVHFPWRVEAGLLFCVAIPAGAFTACSKNVMKKQNLRCMLAS